MHDAIACKERSAADSWTTNFDGLPARACAAENVPCVKVGIDTQHRVSLVPIPAIRNYFSAGSYQDQKQSLNYCPRTRGKRGKQA
jgi:hypothetical protein